MLGLIFWTLQCSSFLGLSWFLARTLIRTTQKGTTLEGLGKDFYGIYKSRCKLGLRLRVVSNFSRCKQGLQFEVWGSGFRV